MEHESTYTGKLKYEYTIYMKDSKTRTFMSDLTIAEIAENHLNDPDFHSVKRNSDGLQFFRIGGHWYGNCIYQE